MNEENNEYAELLKLYARKITGFNTPLTKEEKKLIMDLGKTIFKRQIPRMVKHKIGKQKKKNDSYISLEWDPNVLDY